MTKNQTFMMKNEKYTINHESVFMKNAKIFPSLVFLFRLQKFSKNILCRVSVDNLKCRKYQGFAFR